MAYAALDQRGKSATAERRSWSAAASSCASRSGTAVVTRVRLIRASSLSLPERSLPTRSTRPSSRSHGAGHLEASAANGGTAAAIRQKQWLDHRSHRNGRVECVSTLSQKAWLSRVKVAAPFKSRFLIRSIAGSSQSSRRLTTFWFPVGSAPSACA